MYVFLNSCNQKKIQMQSVKANLSYVYDLREEGKKQGYFLGRLQSAMGQVSPAMCVAEMFPSPDLLSQDGFPAPSWSD